MGGQGSKYHGIELLAILCVLGKYRAFQIFSFEKSVLGTEKHWKGWRRRSRPSQVAKI